MAAAGRRTDLFVWHVQDDESWLAAFKKHVPLPIQDLTQVRPGEVPREALLAQLARAHVTVLLVSASLLAELRADDEALMQCLRQAQADGMNLTWLPLSSVMAEAYDILQRQPLIAKERPLNTLDEGAREAALVEAARKVTALMPKPSDVDQGPAPELLAALKELVREHLNCSERNLPLNEFVVPHVAPFDRARDSGLDWFRHTASDETNDLQQQVHATLEADPGDGPCPAMALFGPAGTGKSMSLYWVRRRYLEQARDALDNGILPRVLPLLIGTDGLKDALQNPLRALEPDLKPDQPTVAQLHGLRARLLFVVEDLHNAADGEALADGFCRDYRWLVSCRPGLARHVPRGAACYRLLGFDERQRELLRRLVAVDAGDDAQNRAGFLRWIQRGRLNDLVRVPQLWRLALGVGSEELLAEDVSCEADLYRPFVERAYKRIPDVLERACLQTVLPLLGLNTLERPKGLVPVEDVAVWLDVYGRGRGGMQVQTLLSRLPRGLQPVMDREQLGLVHGNLALFLAAEALLRWQKDVLPDLPDHEDYHTLRLFLAEGLLAQGDVQAAENLITFTCDKLSARGQLVPLVLWTLRLSARLIPVALDALRHRITRLGSSDLKLVRHLLRARDPDLLSVLTKGLSQADRRRVTGGDTQSRRRRKALKKERRHLQRRVEEGFTQKRETSQAVWTKLSRTREALIKRQLITNIGLNGVRDEAGALLRFLDDADGYVRGDTAKALALLGNPVAVPALLKRLHHPEEVDKVKSIILSALTVLEAHDAVSEMRSFLQADNGHHRGIAAKAFGLLGGPEHVPQIVSLLSDTNPAVRGAAATALGLLGDGAAVAPLCALLAPGAEPAPNVRGSAATALGLLGDGAAVAPLCALLAPDAEKAPDVRGSAATALGLLGDGAAVAPLCALLKPGAEQAPDVRGSAAKALGLLGDGAAVPPLCALLAPGAEKAPDVRGSAATALGLLGDGAAVARLCALLAPGAEKDPANRGAAATALGLLGDGAAVNPLCALLAPGAEQDPAVRGAAARALGLLSDGAAVARLCALLAPGAEQASDVRGSAATALGLLGDGAAVARLCALLAPDVEKDPANRSAAATALCLIGLGLDPTRLAAGALRAALERACTDSDPAVVRSARLGLARLAQANPARPKPTVRLFDGAYACFLAAHGVGAGAAG